MRTFNFANIMCARVVCLYASKTLQSTKRPLQAGILRVFLFFIYLLDVRAFMFVIFYLFGLFVCIC